MQRNPQDRWLIGIVIGAILLVIIAMLSVLRQGPPEYQADGTPEAAVHNYLLAFARDDYARAYGYVSPTVSGYPADLATFTADIIGSPYMFGQDRNEGVAIIDSQMVNDDLAVVTVETTQLSNGGLFGSSQYSYQFSMTLVRSDDGWQVTKSDQYWLPCWTEGNCGTLDRPGQRP